MFYSHLFDTIISEVKYNMSDSLITKRALAKSLKELCQYRNFEKISINDLTNNCNLNRQTFYYHFQDKYDLLQWLYYDELFVDIENIITFSNWDQCLLKVLKKIYQEKDFYISTINTNEQYFYQDLYNLSQKCFYDAITKLDTSNTVSIQEKNFFSEFYAYGISGTVLQWIKTNMKIPPQKLAHDLKKIATQSEIFAVELLNN